MSIVLLCLLMLVLYCITVANALVHSQSNFTDDELVIILDALESKYDAIPGEQIDDAMKLNGIRRKLVKVLEP